jgi:hypothetical protein
MKYYEWESIDDELFSEAGTGDYVFVKIDEPYLEKMKVQNKKVLVYLETKYPDRTFRVSKWHKHDFGDYQDIEEKVEYDDGGYEE